MTDEQFKFLFGKFDDDNDGKISYKDFQKTVGSEIHPAEGLYFRQDKKMNQTIDTCKNEKCWQAIAGIGKFCSLHQKMNQDNAEIIFSKIFKKLGSKWSRFIYELKKNAHEDDPQQIFLSNFVKVLNKYGYEMAEQEQEVIGDAYPGIDEGEKKKLNIARLYDQKYNLVMNKMYHKVDVHDNQVQDDPTDACGYLGQFYREKKKLEEVNFTQFVQLLKDSNKIVDVFSLIKQIDQDRNGYVTLNELDDILKITCPEKFSDKNLDPIIRKFSSLQNRILIDYKRFRQTIVDHPLYKNENMEFSGQKDEQKKREYLEARVNVSKHKSIEARENSGSRNILQGSLSAMPLQESPSLGFHNIQAKTPIDIATYENSYVAQSVKKN